MKIIGTDASGKALEACTPDDITWFCTVVHALPWRAAKSAQYASIPHEYVFPGRNCPLTKHDFYRLNRVMRAWGQPRTFGNKPQQHTPINLTYNEHSYFTTDQDNEAVGNIQRGPHSRRYTSKVDHDTEYPGHPREHFAPEELPFTELDGASGVWDLMSYPQNKSIPPSKYTNFGRRQPTPTERMDTPMHRELRRIVREHFPDGSPATLELACRTGAALDSGAVSPRNYTGVEWSRGMLNELVHKYPTVQAVHNSVLPGPDPATGEIQTWPLLICANDGDVPRETLDEALGRTTQLAIISDGEGEGWEVRKL